MSGFAGGQQHAVSLAKKFVTESDGPIPGFRDASANGQELIVTRWLNIAAMGVNDHDVTIVCDFHGFVLDTEGAHQFHATNLEPDEIVRVVNDAHLIGLGVAHPYRSVMMRQVWHDRLLRLVLPDRLAFLQK
jgi:hypothetical protein